MAIQALAFAPLHNTPGINPKTGKPYKDADYFRRQAQAFLDVMEEEYGYEGKLVVFDNKIPFAQRGKQVLDALVKEKNVNVVSFACHGWKNGIQAGFDLKTVKKLAAAIAKAGNGQYLVVPLFCCSTGDGTPHTPNGPGGDGGFADGLRDELCRAGCIYCVVMGHDTAGDTVTNPYAVFFRGDGSATGGNGGMWIVAPDAKMFKAWKAELKSNSDFKYRFATMTLAAIHDELS